MKPRILCANCGELTISVDTAKCAVCETEVSTEQKQKAARANYVSIINRPTGSTFCGVLVGASVLGAGMGVLSLSEATMGVGFIAGACLLAIWARIAQAADYHRR
jgi:hypothetical protein